MYQIISILYFFFFFFGILPYRRTSINTCTRTRASLIDMHLVCESCKQLNHDQEVHLLLGHLFLCYASFYSLHFVNCILIYECLHKVVMLICITKHLQHLYAISILII